MKIRTYLRKPTNRVNVRVSDKIEGAYIDFKIGTEIFIDEEYYDANIPGYTDTPNVPKEVRESTNAQLKELLDLVESEYEEGCDKIWLAKLVRKFFHPDEVVYEADTEVLTEFFDIADEYIRVMKPVKENGNAIRAILRRLRRYEAWQQQMEGREDFKLTLKEFNREEIENYLEYHYNEYEHFCNYPEFFEQFTLYHRTITPSSKNSISSCLGRLKAFLNWTVKQGYDTDLSFRALMPEPRVYGTPYYLTVEERDKLYDYDFSLYPQAELARDIFVFNCFVGCRVGDLLRLTRDNIKDGWLEYIPNKTIVFDKYSTVRVPLADKAIAILDKYSNLGNRLFPLIDQHVYGSFIKFCLSVAGINRTVTILNPLTREAEQKPLYEVMTTHSARKTFVGNLYRQVKDQALVASLSGHSAASRAFERYRTIDDDMKREVLTLIQ